MQEIYPQIILNKLQSPQRVNFLTKWVHNNKIKLSKKVYNLESRNIKQFIKQHRQIEQRSKAKDFNPKKKPLDQNKKYDQNQLLQLQYKLRQQITDPVYIKQKSRSQIQSQFSQLSLRSKNRSKIYNKTTSKNNIKISDKNIKNSQKNGSLQKSKTGNIRSIRTKQISHIQHSLLKNLQYFSSDCLPRILIRKKSKTIFQDPKLDNNKSTSFIRIQQSQQLSNILSHSTFQKNSMSLKIKSKEANQNKSLPIDKSNKNISNSIKNGIKAKNNQKLIQITDDKMIRYLKGLHTVTNGYYSHGKPLDQNKVTRLVLERFTIQRKLKQAKETEQTDSILQQHPQLIPYMDLISQSQTRKSIHRIVNMSVRNTQKLAFKLLDFNKNGVIDQKDLVYLIQLSTKIPQLKFDLVKISKFIHQEENYSISNALSLTYRQNSSLGLITPKNNGLFVGPNSMQSSKNSSLNRQLKKFIKVRERKNNRSHTYSGSQMSQFASDMRNSKINQRGKTCSIDKQKHFLFLQSKKQFFQLSKQNMQKFKVSINMQIFHKIFGNQRPIIFYDMLKYMFRIKSQDLINENPDYFGQKLQNNISKQQTTFQDKQSAQSFKNYNVPKIIKDMQNKFESNMQISRYQQVLNISKIQVKKITNQNNK